MTEHTLSAKNVAYQRVRQAIIESLGTLADSFSLFLNSEDYFTCEKLHCRMRVKWCLNRHKKSGTFAVYRRGESNKFRRFPECYKCKQGKEIENESKKNDAG